MKQTNQDAQVLFYYDHDGIIELINGIDGTHKDYTMLKLNLDDFIGRPAVDLLEDYYKLYNFIASNGLAMHRKAYDARRQAISNVDIRDIVDEAYVQTITMLQATTAIFDEDAKHGLFQLQTSVYNQVTYEGMVKRATELEYNPVLDARANSDDILAYMQEANADKRLGLDERYPRTEEMHDYYSLAREALNEKQYTLLLSLITFKLNGVALTATQRKQWQRLTTTIQTHQRD